MKKSTLARLLAAVAITASICSCNKDGNTDPFDHFEITYSLETNEDCRNCFDTKFEILCNDTVLDSDYFNSISMNGTFTDSRMVPNATITFRTVPSYDGTIPEEIDLLLKYDIVITAINKSGEVADSYSIRETRSGTGKVSLKTADEQKAAKDEFTIDIKVKSTISGGKLSITPAN